MSSNLLDVVSFATACAATIAAPSVAAYTLIVVHEAAHAVVARALGTTVLSIEVGGGPSWCSLWWGRTEVILRKYPLHGFVRLAPASPRWLRTRAVVTFLAGPCANITLAVVFVSACVATLGSLSTPVGPGHFWWFVLALATLTVLLVTLLEAVPRRVSIRRGTFPNDLAQVASTLRMRPNHVVALLDFARLQQAQHEFWRLFALGECHQARAQADARAAQDPADWTPLGEAALVELVLAGPERALAAWSIAATRAQAVAAALKLEGKSRRELDRVLQINRVFFLTCVGGAAELAEAERLAATGVFDSTAAGIRTRGLVRLRQRRPGSALTDLDKAWRMEEPTLFRSLCAAYIAQAHAMLGKKELARRWLRRARRLSRRNPLLPHCERQVAQALAQR